MNPEAGREQSVRHLAEGFSAFALASASGEVRVSPGLTIAAANVAMPALNMAILTERAEENAIGQRVRDARAYFFARRRTGILIACEEWLDASGRAAIERNGLAQAVTLTGMAADRLRAPARQPPCAEIRRVSGRGTLDALGEINAICYSDPPEWGREAVGREDAWRERIFGHVAFSGGQPVSAAAAVPVDGALYVAWVATLPEHRGKGYAEAVMRASLAEAARAAGDRPAALHATPAGFAMYLRMGFVPQARFAVFRAEPAIPSAFGPELSCPNRTR